MSGRLAVDFGTSNTVLAVWDEARQEGVPLFIPEYCRRFQQGEEWISVSPSLIHYAVDQRQWIGNQVLQNNLYHSPGTFRWMKRYISNRSPIKINLHGQEITPFQAGRDFLSTLLVFAAQELNLQDEEVAFSAPVESYEHYENWLADVAQAAGITRFRLIDEPSAAALGYGAHIQPGNVYLIFDFGGGTLHASVVLMDEEEDSNAGRRCRVLGKAGRSIGGTSIDQWLFEEVLKQNSLHDSDAEVRRISNALLVECERAKEILSFEDTASFSVMNPETGAVLAANFTRADFEDLLDQHDLFTQIHQTIRSALNEARERGYDENAIHSALMVGGGSQIPSVQRTLKQIFGRDKVLSNRPLDAVARGAAAFAAGVDFYDHIQHNYAIRYINPQKGDYDYYTIVEKGTPYPSSEPIARLAVKASYEGQKQLGIAIFEIGDQHFQQPENAVELVFDPGGAARVVQLTPHEKEQRAMFWMNENSPTFLNAEPPGRKGEPRFDVEFKIDANKRLTLTARDRMNGVLTHQDYPVVKLS